MRRALLLGLVSTGAVSICIASCALSTSGTLSESGSPGTNTSAGNGGAQSGNGSTISSAAVTSTGSTVTSTSTGMGGAPATSASSSDATTASTTASTTAAVTSAAVTTAAVTSSSTGGGPCTEGMGTVCCAGSDCAQGEICCVDLAQKSGVCGQAGACAGVDIEASCDDSKECPAGQICCGSFNGFVYTKVGCAAPGDCNKFDDRVCALPGGTCPPGKGMTETCTTSKSLPPNFGYCL